MKQFIIVDEFKSIVERVSVNMIDQLKTYDDKIKGVHYEHGHPLEIIQTLKQKDETRNFRFDRYPVIALFQDFPEVNDDSTGIQSEVTLHLIIARATKPEYKAAERYDYNFRPVLYPVYKELKKQIHASRAFITKGPELVRHTKIDRLYWGREGLWKNEGNIFNDWIDCIELKNLKLKVNQKLCI